MAATVEHLRRANRARVLEQLVYSGSMSRTVLGRRLELSSGGITNIVDDLVADGLVVEEGTRATRGRPVTLLKPNAEAALFIGAEVGERDVAVELFDLSMTLRESASRELRDGRSDPALVGALLRDAVDEIVSRHPGRVNGIGLAVPGTVETPADGGGPIVYAPSLGWKPTPVSVLLDAEIPVYAENATSVTALAEQRLNRDDARSHFTVAHLGRWVGLGAVMNGELVRGSNGMAGQWGHTTVEPTGPLCRCGSRGCLESLVGAEALLGQWHAAGGPDQTGSGWDRITALCEAARDGDPIASGVITDALQRLGISLGNVITLLNPERVFISGWVGLRLMHYFGAELDAAVKSHAFGPSTKTLQIVPTSFGGDTTAVGAALIPLARFIEEIAAGSAKSVS